MISLIFSVLVFHASSVMASDEKPSCILGEGLPPKFTVEDIRDFLNNSKVKENEDPIDALICCLPGAYRTRPVYVYDSGSQQAASEKLPRTLLGGFKGDLILAFSGGSNSVEIIEGKEEKKEIKKETKTEYKLHFTLFQPTSLGAGKQSNPDCARCHHGHHLWNTYFLWPGVYGSDDGELTEKEKPFAEKFFASKPNLKRYRCIQQDYFMSRNNENFGGAIFGINVKRVSSLLENDPALIPYRAALLGIGLCGQKKSDFEKEQLFDSSQKASFSSLATYVPESVMSPLVLKESLAVAQKHLDTQEHEYVVERLGEIGPGAGRRKLLYVQLMEYSSANGPPLSLERLSEFPNDALASISVITKNLAGSHTMDNWGLAPHKNIPSFNDGNPGPKGTHRFILELMQSLKEKWAKDLGLGASDSIDLKFCKALAEKSNKVLTQYAEELKPHKALPKRVGKPPANH